MKPLSPLSDNIAEHLENPQSYQDAVNDILKSLDKLLDNMKKNHSIISYMAEYWGKLPTWIKITAGVVFFGSFLLIGILTLSTLIIVTTCVCSVLYTLISLGLDNHYSTINDENDKLKSKMLSLGSFLSAIIQKLNDIRLTLSTEIKRLQGVVDKTKIDFEGMVSKLTAEVNQFKKSNDGLAVMVVNLTSHFSENQESIKLFKDNLDRHLNDLKAGKADFLQALSNILGLEKDLAALKKDLDTSLKHNETLFIKYDELVKQHQKRLDMSNKNLCSTGMQTEPILHAKQLLKHIINPPESVDFEQSQSNCWAKAQPTLY